MPGYLARGSASITTPRGTFTGTISVAMADAGRCRVEMEFGSGARPRTITAAFDGSKGGVVGPATLLRAAPIPFGLPTGCALLAPQPSQNASAFQLSLVTSAGGTQVASINWKLGSRALSVAYRYASPRDALPVAVTESVDGVARLEVRFTSVTPKAFPITEFLAPAGGAR